MTGCGEGTELQRVKYASMMCGARGNAVPQPVDDAAAAAIGVRTKGVIAALHQHFEPMFPEAMRHLDEAFARHRAVTTQTEP
jgi:hypothetical protein